MMENRSFDHFFGWVPGADGMQAGLEFVDKQGVTQQTYPLAPEFQGCQYGDPDHSYKGGRTQFADGANDGWLLASTDDNFPIGYYEAKDLSFFGGAVPAWTIFDRYFCAIMSSTYPNRMYMHTGQTDRLSNTLTASTLPAIWDRLAAAGLSGTYYYSDLPVTALFGSRFLPISKPYDAVPRRCRRGQLAQRHLHRPALHQRGSRHLERRPPVRRHPQRPGLHQRGLRRDHARARTGRTPCWSSTTTSGAASSTTCRRRSRR